MDHLAKTSIQCRLFESTNIVVKRRCVHTSATFFRLLQLNVMNSFYQIASGHVHPFFIIELLQIKGKKISPKYEMSQRR
jgi:hypothetical protein